MKDVQKPWGIHWFRRDLRIEGNLALETNRMAHVGRTLGLFCFDSKFLARSDFSHHRFAFFLKSLESLKASLASHGGDLLVIDEEPSRAFPTLLHWLKSQHCPLPSLVTWNRDYEPFARARDKEISGALDSFNILHQDFRDHLLFEPWEITKSAGSGEKNFYQIYSPFARKWFEKINSEEGQTRLAYAYGKGSTSKRKLSSENGYHIQWNELSHGDFPYSDSLQKFIQKNSGHIQIEIPTAGHAQASTQLNNFLKRIRNYGEHRDFPSTPGTSRLSMFLKNGTITVPQIISHLPEKSFHFNREDGVTKFLKELVWREFYYHILYHQPSVEVEAFQEKYRHIAWENNEEHFELWKLGQTGFPIVDAGMRELATTGWMHNRVRMIVASFLTKDLLINWQWGEKYFMQTLLDGDLAPNNGGWQWAASTGCDPQPYFRIFNPWLQSAKFDPEGTYIKTFVPELKHAPTKALHAPTADRSQWGYPEPIVDHNTQKIKALQLYRSIANK